MPIITEIKCSQSPKTDYELKIAQYNGLFHFFIRVFTGTDDSRDSRRREWTIFISLYQFHALTNIKAFNIFAIKYI